MYENQNLSESSESQKKSKLSFSSKEVWMSLPTMIWLIGSSRSMTCFGKPRHERTHVERAGRSCPAHCRSIGTA